MSLIKRLSGIILLLLAVPVFIWRRGDVTLATLLYVAFTVVWIGVREGLTRGDPLKTVSANVDRLERTVLFVVVVGMFLLPLVALYTPLLDFAVYRPSALATAVGAVAMVAGVYVLYRSHADLGAFWSPTLEIRDGHELVTTGIYSRVRHPMYTAIFLICIGQALLLENWLAGIAGLITFTVLYISRVEREEQLMIQRFGKAYRSYAKRTQRLVPRLF